MYIAHAHLAAFFCLRRHHYSHDFVGVYSKQCGPFQTKRPCAIALPLIRVSPLREQRTMKALYAHCKSDDWNIFCARRHPVRGPNRRDCSTYRPATTSSAAARVFTPCTVILPSFSLGLLAKGTMACLKPCLAASRMRS